MPSSIAKVQLAIQATPAEIWNALVDGDITPAYYFGYEARFELEPGRPYRYVAGDDVTLTGTVVAVEPERRLETTFNGHWAPEVDGLPESRVTIEIVEPAMPTPGVAVLSLVHTELPDDVTAAHLELGWVSILSSLKTLLETGRPLPAPAFSEAASA